jgi:hypothetical protein
MSARARRSISLPCLLLAASALVFAVPKRSAAQVLYGSIVGNVGDGADFMTITSVQDLGREGIDERQFRLGLRIVF